jgi:hypothetical protein
MPSLSLRIGCFVFFKIRLKSSTLSCDTNDIALPVAPARAVLFSCPCCGYKLRTKPRSLKYKAKLKAEIEEDKILLSVQPVQKAIQK